MAFGAPFTDLVVSFFKLFGFYNVISLPEFIRYARATVCKFLPQLCEFMDDGFTHESLNNHARIPDRVAHTYLGAGWKNSAHYGQIVRDKRFQRYDYGNPWENMKHYSSLEASNYSVVNLVKQMLGFETAKLDVFTLLSYMNPPEYALERIRVPTVLIYGRLDQIATPTDIRWLW